MSDRAKVLRNIALGLEPDAARELNEAAEELARLRTALEGVVKLIAPTPVSWTPVHRAQVWRNTWDAARAALASTQEAQG